jgi:hypothetical protein
MSAVRFHLDRAHWQGIHVTNLLLQPYTTSGGKVIPLARTAFRFQPYTTTGREVLLTASPSCFQFKTGSLHTKHAFAKQSFKQPWWNKRGSLIRQGTSTVCHVLKEAEERSARARPRDRRPSWNVGGVLDIYLLKLMLPAFGMSLALCAVLGMSLGALVELVREVISAGERCFSSDMPSL